MTWEDSAACISLSPLFFGPDGETEAQRARRESLAKAICWACPVRDDCLAAAIANEVIWGVWGGMGEKDRQRFMGRLRAVRSL